MVRRMPARPLVRKAAVSSALRVSLRVFSIPEETGHTEGEEDLGVVVT